MTIITRHLDKGDQSDYRKITNIPTKLVINHNYNINETKETIILNIDQNQPITYRRDLLNPRKKGCVFLEVC